MDLKDNDFVLPDQDELSNKDVVSFYNSFDSLLKIIENNSTLTKDLANLIKSGKKTIYNKQIKETKEFETAFLDTLEAAYPAFSKIAKNPKSSIKYDEDIVLVEKARKINSQSIRHLSSHSELIREIKDDNVIPSKILTTFAEEDIAIYENRLYKTLVNNIVRFLTRRLTQLEDALEAKQIDEICYNNEISLNNTDKIELDLSIKVKKGLDAEKNKAYDIVHRTDSLLTAYKSLKSTPFMKKLANAKDVFPPLMKTNIILHNPDFKILYNTWIFMERYSSVSYNIGVNDVDFSNDKTVEPKLDSLSLVLLNTLMYHRQNVTGDLTLDSVSGDTINEKKRHAIDMKSGALEGDEYTFSEMYLEEARKLFDEEYKQSLANGVASELSMREAIRKMLKITNQMCPVLFNYKDDDLDEIGKDIDVLISEASDRYEGIKVLREEKEIDLNKTCDEESDALKHLEELKRRKEIILEQQKIDQIRKETEEKKNQELLELKRKEEALKQQEELRKKKDEMLRREALLKEEKRKHYGFHSREHEKSQERARTKLRIFDVTNCLTLDLYNTDPTLKLESRRDYTESDRLSLNDILEEIEEEKACERERARLEELAFYKAFKKRKCDVSRKRERNNLHIKYEESRLNPTGESLNLFMVSNRLDIDTIPNQYKTIEPIVIEPRKYDKLVGMRRTVVKTKKLSKEEIDNLDTRKVVGKNRTLVQKKTKM